MGRIIEATLGSARLRVGLPVLPDGSSRQPLLLRLPGAAAGCNNGCPECLSRPVEGPEAAWTTAVAGRHVVVRDREPTLRRDLRAHLLDLRARGPRSISLLTNGRMLAYPRVVRALRQCGVDRFVVKLFGLDAASHDAHTRQEASFAQALQGIAVACTEGADVLVTFPALRSDDAPRAEATAAQRSLARSLTGHDTVEFPEPSVLAHDGGHGFDVVATRPDAPRVQGTRRRGVFMRINTGPVCNIRCTYCSVDGGDDQRLYDRAYVESVIDAAALRAQGFPSEDGEPVIDFLGGDPTLHPDLARFIAHARGRGFREVGICTNGLLLLKPGYLDGLVSAGLTFVNFSFHDHRPDSARALAGVGAYGARCPEVAEALLSRPEVRSTFFRLLLTSTLDAVPDFVHWVAARTRDPSRVEMHFGLPTVRGRMLSRPEEFPPLARLRPVLAEALSLASAHGIEAFVGPGPACLHPTHPEQSQCLQSETLRANAVTRAEELTHDAGEAAYGRACEGCDARTRGCAGLPSAYFARDYEEADRWLRPFALT